MGNGAAAGVMALDFLVVMNRVLFLETPVNLSHHEHPACSAGNPNSLSVSVIRLLLTHTPSLRVQPCCVFFPCLTFLLWFDEDQGPRGGGGGLLAKQKTSSYSFKH